MCPMISCPTSPRAARLATSVACSACARVNRASTRKARPCVRQLDAAVRPMEEPDAEVLLEATDLLTERGLRDVKALRGSAEVQLFRDGYEVAEVAKFHERTISQSSRSALAKSIGPRARVVPTMRSRTKSCHVPAPPARRDVPGWGQRPAPPADRDPAGDAWASRAIHGRAGRARVAASHQRAPGSLASLNWGRCHTPARPRHPSARCVAGRTRCRAGVGSGSVPHRRRRSSRRVAGSRTGRRKSLPSSDVSRPTRSWPTSFSLERSWPQKPQAYRASHSSTTCTAARCAEGLRGVRDGGRQSASWADFVMPPAPLSRTASRPVMPCRSSIGHAEASGCVRSAVTSSRTPGRAGSSSSRARSSIHQKDSRRTSVSSVHRSGTWRRGRPSRPGPRTTDARSCL